MSVSGCVARLHAARTKFSVILSGGGGGLAGMLLSVPGCSGTLLDMNVPYSTAATADTVGYAPGKFVSDSAAVALAHAAYLRARKLVALEGGEDADDGAAGGDGTPRSPPPRLAGLGCTAALVSSQPRRGLHHARCSVWTADAVVTHTVVLAKDAGRSREDEDNVTSLLALHAMCTAAGVLLPDGGGGGDDAGPSEPSLILLRDVLRSDLGESVTTTRLGRPWTEACLARSGTGSLLLPDGVTWTQGLSPAEPSLVPPDGAPLVVMPGSFNPVHEGHVGLLEAAVRAADHPGAVGVFELSARNADKAAIDENDLRVRAALVRETGHRLAVTGSAPLFVDKIPLFPRGTFFAVGYDTAVRLLDPKYYGGTEAGLLAALGKIRDNDAKVLVAGRAVLGDDKVPDPSKGFLTLSDIRVPGEFAGMFLPIPNFRSDVSSSQIRLQLKQKEKDALSRGPSSSR